LVHTGDRQAELAVAVVDRWQRHGVGRRLLEALGDLAVELGYVEIYGDVLAENEVMVRLLQRVFPGALPRWDDGVVRVPLPGRDPRESAHRALVGP
jgi:GNAT superfamily N-acetyltransferase